MQRYLLCSFLLIATTFSFGQIPNGDFESWTTKVGTDIIGGTYNFDEPDFWKTTDSIAMAVSVGAVHSAQKSTNFHGGSFAISLTGWNAFGQNAPGAASNGDINVTTVSIVKGTPDSVKHNKLTGFYQFTPVSGDTAVIDCSLLRYNWTTSTRDTMAYGHLEITTATAAYTLFDLPLIFRDTTVAPDSMVILLSTSPFKLGSGHAGTNLLVDDLAFIGIVGVDEPSNPVHSVNIYPSPVNNLLNVDLKLDRSVQLQYDIYDLSGRIILNGKIESEKLSVDVRSLAIGNYMIVLNDSQNQKRYFSSKFSIER